MTKRTWRYFNKIGKWMLILAVAIMGLQLPGMTVFAAPSSLKLVVLYNNNNLPNLVKLIWQDTLSNEASYRIEITDFTNSSVSGSLDVSANSTTFLYTVYADHMYSFKIYSRNSSGNLSIHTDEVTINLAELSAPTGLVLVQNSPDQIDLNWTYPESKRPSTVIERRTNGSTWTTIAVTDIGLTQFSDKGLAPNTLFYYRIKAISGPNVETQTFPSAPNDNTGIGCFTELNAPTGLSGFALSNAQIYLEWVDNSDESWFRIERKEGLGGEYKQVYQTAADTVSWTDSDTELKADTTYFYRVYAATRDSISDFCDEISIRTTFMRTPTNLTVNATPDTEMKLTWTDNAANETGYEIWRKKTGEKVWTNYAYVSNNITEFTDREITAGMAYYYKVRAVVIHNNAYSKFSNEATSWSVLISPPTELKATMVGTRKLSLSWIDNTISEKGFKVERKKGMEGNWAELATLSANITSYVDESFMENQQYFYRIKVWNENYNAFSYSDEIEVSTRLPAAPANLTAVSLTPTQIKLSWSDLSNNEWGFTIERRLIFSSYYFKVGTADQNKTSFIDMGVSTQTKYVYRIKAFNLAGDSAYTGEATVLTKSAVTFSDVPVGYWAKKEIESLSSQGIFTIPSGKAFKPDERITRGEFISLLVKAFKIKKIAAGSLTDVKAKHKYYNEIMTAYKMGIFTPDKKKYFFPDNALRREDIAIYLAKTLKVLDKTLPAHDVSILDEYEDKDQVTKANLSYVSSMFGERVMDGKTINGRRYILPKNGATRAEAAVAIYKALDIIE